MYVLAHEFFYFIAFRHFFRDDVENNSYTLNLIHAALFSIYGSLNRN